MLDEARSARNIVRGLMPIVVIGLIIVLLALFLMRWPSPVREDPASTTVTPHFQRITVNLAAKDPSPASMILDLTIYVAVLAAMVLTLMAWRRGTRGPLSGLMIIGLLGVAYAGGMALYNGPMISICGFMFILFGALVARFALPGDVDSDTDPESDVFEVADITPEMLANLDQEVKPTGIDDYASHPIA